MFSKLLCGWVSCSLLWDLRVGTQGALRWGGAWQTGYLDWLHHLLLCESGAATCPLWTQLPHLSHGDLGARLTGSLWGTVRSLMKTFWESNTSIQMKYCIKTVVFCIMWTVTLRTPSHPLGVLPHTGRPDVPHSWSPAHHVHSRLALLLAPLTSPLSPNSWLQIPSPSTGFFPSG